VAGQLNVREKDSMGANLNAIGTLATVIVTVPLAWRFWKAEIKGHGVLMGLLCLLLLAAINVILTHHACHRGQPIFQWLIPGLCLVLLIAVMKDRRARVAIVAFFIVVSLCLSRHYVELVHSEGYVGNPRSLVLRNAIVAGDGGDGEVKSGPRPVEAYRLWHTGFTGIYRVTEKR